MNSNCLEILRYRTLWWAQGARRNRNHHINPIYKSFNNKLNQEVVIGIKKLWDGDGDINEERAHKDLVEYLECLSVGVVVVTSAFTHAKNHQTVCSRLVLFIEYVLCFGEKNLSAEVPHPYHDLRHNVPILIPCLWITKARRGAHELLSTFMTAWGQTAYDLTCIPYPVQVDVLWIFQSMQSSAMATPGHFCYFPETASSLQH